jgi:hypothetical protein
MLLDGFRGRMRIGEVVELWTLEEEVITNALPAFRWHPIAAIDDSNSTYRRLRSLKSSAETVDLNAIFPRLDLANPKIPRLLVYLATSGTDELQGTPFDDRINVIFRDHRGRLMEDGYAFITVLVAQEGEWVGHSITPGDRNPHIPPFPPIEKEPEPPTEELSTNTPAPLLPSSATVTNQPKPMTADEIAVKMREADRLRALTSAPPVSAESTNPSVTLSNTATPPQPPPTVDTPPTEPPAPTNLVETPPAEPTETPAISNRTPPSAVATNTPTLADVAQPPPPTNKVEAPNSTQPPPESLPLESEPAPAAPEAARGPYTSPPPTQPPQGLSPWKDLLVGIALLTAAVALAVLLIRQMLPRSRGSLISQSLGSPPDSSGKPPGSES